MSITPRTFAEAMELKCIVHASGEDKETICVPEINRPGLQFAGYFEIFASERPQLIGKAEMAYLQALDPDTAEQRLAMFFSYPMPCIVIARNISCPPEFEQYASRAGVPVYVSAERTSHIAAKATMYLSEVFAPRETRHGVLMDVFGQGVLITGESGIGKSECALELIKHGHQLVADDVVDVCRIGITLWGEAPEMVRDLMELRGVGIVNVRMVYGIGAIERRKKIDMVIELDQWEPNKSYDRLGSLDRKVDILGISVPYMEIPVRPGRSLATIVEIAARCCHLRTEGYDAANELDRRMRERYHIEEE